MSELYGLNINTGTYTSPSGATSKSEYIKPNSSSSSTNMSGTTASAMAIQSVSNIAMGELATRAFEKQVEADTTARIANMDRVTTNYEIEATKTKESLDLMDSMFADKISERGLQRMKDRATLRASGAETGTTGGSTNEAINEAYVTEHFDVANINASRNQQLSSVMNSLNIKQITASNQLESIASGNIQVDNNALLAGIAGGTSITGSNLSMMTADERASLYGMSSSASGTNTNTLKDA